MEKLKFLIALIKSARRRYIWGSIDDYDEDGLMSIHNHDFINDKNFIDAYSRGKKANNGTDYHFRWRVRVALWAANQASKLEGDFVELGVWTGFLSSAICQYLDWNNTNKNFLLFDTWSGIDESLLTDEEKFMKRADKNNWIYNKDIFFEVQKNFSEWKGISLHKGSLPTSLKGVKIGKIAYLSIDLNNSQPEIAAMNILWPKIVPGGVVLIDDYGYKGYEPQHFAWDEWAKKTSVNILPLPTGQGIIIK